MGLTNPLSPLNPLNNDDRDELSSYDIHKVELLKDRINDLEYREENRKHLQKILVELKEMRDYANLDNIVGWSL